MTRFYLLATIAILAVAFGLACVGSGSSTSERTVSACFGPYGCGNPNGDDDTMLQDDDNDDAFSGCGSSVLNQCYAAAETPYGDCSSSCATAGSSCAVEYCDDGCAAQFYNACAACAAQYKCAPAHASYACWAACLQAEQNCLQPLSNCDDSRYTTCTDQRDACTAKCAN